MRRMRVRELGHVGDAVLEEVADALVARLEQLARVRGNEVLREEQDAGARVQPADRLGGAHALVGARRRHADVDDGDVGRLVGHVLEQLVRAPGLGDDPHAGLFEQAGDAVADEHGVVGEDDAEAVVVDAAGEAGRREVCGSPSATSWKRRCGSGTPRSS